ncbi:Bacterial SH3 domain protein [Rickettsiales endosymbiont of Paramecium tredecaurelia]|nr:Bacterial SH3 domain protein [Candidatus Sarmatiella mevalonica]
MKICLTFVFACYCFVPCFNATANITSDCKIKQQQRQNFSEINIDKEVKKSPRFVSIKFNKVNARSDPDFNAPVEWIFNQKWEPLLVLDEYEHWRKIQDISGYRGWMHKSSLSTKRSVVVICETSMRKKPNTKAKINAKLCSQVRCFLLKEEGTWCKISCMGYNGWVEKECLWGVYYNY